MTTISRSQKIIKVAKQRQRDIVVVLEDIHDPHNSEAIFRTCDASGVQNVELIFNTVEPFNPRAIGKATSSSANKWLDFRIYAKGKLEVNPLRLGRIEARSNKEKETKDSKLKNPTEKCLLNLKKQGYSIVAAALNDKAENIYDFIWPEKIALLVGNEHAGSSEAALKLADHYVQIPMLGMVQSLNVSVSTAIFLSEIYRFRLGRNFQLSSIEQQKLIEDFLQR